MHRLPVAAAARLVEYCNSIKLYDFCGRLATYAKWKYICVFIPAFECICGTIFQFLTEGQESSVETFDRKYSLYEEWIFIYEAREPCSRRPVYSPWTDDLERWFRKAKQCGLNRIPRRSPKVTCIQFSAAKWQHRQIFNRQESVLDHIKFARKRLVKDMVKTIYSIRLHVLPTLCVEMLRISFWLQYLQIQSHFYIYRQTLRLFHRNIAIFLKPSGLSNPMVQGPEAQENSEWDESIFFRQKYFRGVGWLGKVDFIWGSDPHVRTSFEKALGCIEL